MDSCTIHSPYNALPCQVLVIEDEKSICNALELLFELSGSKAIFINSFDEALSWVEKHKVLPPLTLVDRRLHNKDGFTLIRTLRKMTNQNSAIYLFSADRISLAEAMSHGATGIIPKPFEADALLQLIERYTLESITK